MKLLKVIIIEDSEDDLLLILRALKKGDFEVVYTCVETEEDFKVALEDEDWQFVICDHSMPQFSAPAALAALKESGNDLPFIIVSGTIGEDVAVAAMKAGAHDYLMKDNLARLAPAVDRELRDAAIRWNNRLNKERLEYMTQHDALTGVYNRLYFENELLRLDGGDCYPITLIIFDLHGLKLVNETMGQKEGDSYLINCSEIIKKPMRNGDTLARIGGDEFAVIIPDSDEANAKAFIEGVNENIGLFNQCGKQLPLSLSSGYAVCQSNMEKLEDTLVKAHHLMDLDKQSRSGSSRNQVVNALLAALSERDYIANGHAERMLALCVKMGQAVGLDQYRLSALELVAQIHDLGKIGIPDHILFKKSSLSPEEWQVMRQHPEKGFRIASASPELESVAKLILHHHERYDGTGYPMGLKEDTIPLECRILSIVDAFDAMTNERPYSKAKTFVEALAELKKCAGSQFDPDLVRLFLKLLDQD